MSTRATEAHFPASQAEVARGDQVPSKRTPRGGLGKTASAGFAQILGDQVAKSSATTKVAEKIDEQPVPHTAGPHTMPQSLPRSPANATPQSLPQSLPQAAPQSLTAAGEKEGPRVFAQIRFDRSEQASPDTSRALARKSQHVAAGEHRASGTAPLTSTEKSGHEVDTGQPVRLAAPRQDSLSGKSDSPTPNDQVGHIAATPTKTREISTSAQVPAGRVAPASSPPDRMPEVSRSGHVFTSQDRILSSQTSVAGVAVSHTRAPSTVLNTSENTPRVSIKAGETAIPVPFQAGKTAVQLQAQVSSTATHGRSTASENTPRLSTKTSETTTPLPSKAGEAVVHAPAPTSDTAAHVMPAVPTPNLSTKASEAAAPVPFKTGESATPSPSPPTIPPTEVAKHSATPPVARHSFAVSAKAEHVPHTPDFEFVPNPREPHAGKTSSPGTPAFRPGLVAHPTTQPPASPPSEVSQQGSLAAGEPPTKELPRAVPAPAPRVTASDIHPSAPVVLAPELSTRAEDSSIHSPAHVDHHVVASASPAHEQKAQTHAVHAQALPIAQPASLPISPPSPPTVPQDAATAQVPPIPQPVGPPETSRPVATAKASGKQVIAMPTAEQPSAREETKPAESPSDAATPEPKTNPLVAFSEGAASATTDKTATASPKHAPASPAPEAGHVGNESSLQVEPVASKRRAHVEEKAPEETTTAPAKPSPANPLPSLSSPGASIEFKVPKPEAPPSAEQSAATENSSQTGHVPSAAAQPHAIKDDVQPSTLAPAGSPTVFAPPSIFMTAHSGATAGEIPAPASVAAERSALVDRAIEDPGLSVTVMPHSAHLAITGDTGDLALHVRVRDGSADVNVSGTMAPLFDSKAHEVRTVLAGEGLHLGNFATDQRGSSQGQQGQPESAPRPSDPHPLPPPRRANTSAPEIQITNDRRIHVTA